MKQLLSLVITLCLSSVCLAQYIPDENTKTNPPSKEPVLNSPWTKKPTTTPKSTPIPKPTGNSAEAHVQHVIETLFHHMRNSDANGVRSVFTDDARLVATGTENGRPVARTTAITDFANQIGQTQPGSLDERITDIEVKIDQGLATAWVDYEFYLNGAFHHCGVDAFQLHNAQGGWKIFQIADTRREACVTERGQINQLLDGWHAAASRADSRTYFDLLYPNAVYLGTDESENWSKDEFYEFARPFFQKGQAWKFQPRDRNVFFSPAGDVTWFNEILDTWMGPCRGSGVLTRDENGAWKLAQYNLAMLVPNDLVQDYLALKKQKGM